VRRLFKYRGIAFYLPYVSANPATSLCEAMGGGKERVAATCQRSFTRQWQLQRPNI